MTITRNRFFLCVEKCKKHLFWRLLYYLLIVTYSATFLISGFRKMPGVKFTILNIEDPIGFFFEAMYRTGVYWNLIGYIQIAIATIIYFPKFRAVAVLTMFVININILFITLGLHMIGTPVIAVFMVLGNIYLMLWHYKNFLPLFFTNYL